MGSSSSKLFRSPGRLTSKQKLGPTRVTDATGIDGGRPHQLHPAARQPMASELKGEAIEQDSKDPQLIGNLYRLGQASWNQTTLSGVNGTVRQKASVVYQFERLEESEQQASSSRKPKNRLQVHQLASILDERKTVGSAEELSALASRYDIDSAVLQRLSARVNTPSISGQASTRRMESDGEHTSMLALWQEPRVK